MGEIVEKLKRVRPVEEKGEKTPEAGLDVLKKPRAEISDAEIEFLRRENPERLKEIRRVVREDIREKEEEIGILREKLQSLKTDYKEVFICRPPIAKTTKEAIKSKAPPGKSLIEIEKSIDSAEKKLKKAETELDELKQTKEKLQKYAQYRKKN